MKNVRVRPFLFLVVLGLACAASTSCGGMPSTSPPETRMEKALRVCGSTMTEEYLQLGIEIARSDCEAGVPYNQEIENALVGCQGCNAVYEYKVQECRDICEACARAVVEAGYSEAGYLFPFPDE